MPTNSDGEFRRMYDDLLEGTGGERRLRLLRHLDAGYRLVHHGLVTPPDTQRWVASRSGRPAAGRRGAVPDSPHRRFMGPFRWQRTGWRISTIPLVPLALGIGVTLAMAAGGILNLGKPTNNQSTNAYFPLSGFSRGGMPLQVAGKPEFLWIGTAWPGDVASDAERWPVVKALEQFGTFSDLAIGPQTCIMSTYGGTAEKTETVHPCTPATFDWTHSQYHSRYVSFVHKDLLDPRARLFQKLSPAEARLFDRYVGRKPGNTPRAIATSIYAPDIIPTNPTRVFPLLAIGGYKQTVSGEPLIGDFGSPRFMTNLDVKITHHLAITLYLQTLTFRQAQDALDTGVTPHLPGIAGQPPPSFSGLIPDVNGEANVITALICHADGGKPGSVCGRPVIKQLLRHVK